MTQTGVKEAVAGVQEETVVAAAGPQCNTRLLSLMEKLIDRVERLEQKRSTQYPGRKLQFGPVTMQGKQGLRGIAGTVADPATLPGTF